MRSPERVFRKILAALPLGCVSLHVHSLNKTRMYLLLVSYVGRVLYAPVGCC